MSNPSDREHPEREKYSKAHTSRSRPQDKSVDRHHRPRSPHSRSDRSRDYDARSRHARDTSPDGSDYDSRGYRGQKRSFEGNQRMSDGRRFKIHYEDPAEGADAESYHRSSDRNDPRRYHDRGNGPDRSFGWSDRREQANGQALHPSTDSELTTLSRSTTLPPAKSTSLDATPHDVSPSQLQTRGQSADEYVLKSRSAQWSEADIKHSITSEADVLPTPINEDAVIEARRQRRQALRAKHKTSEPPLLQKVLETSLALPAEGESGSQQHLARDHGQHQTAQEAGKDYGLPKPASLPTTPTTPTTPIASAIPSFAHDSDLANPAAKRTIPSSELPLKSLAGTPPLAKKATEAEDEFDMFASDDDDAEVLPDQDKDVVLADSEAKARKDEAEDGTQATRFIEARQLDQSMLDDWDDPQGYYRVILGELLDNRYAVQEIIGKGVSSSVVRAVDTTDNHLVAIKIIIKHEQMRRYGLTEMAWMRTLAEADPDDRRHILRLERHFDHKGHLCVVFESLSINLREVLKKFGRDIGINIRAVRVYAHQMFLALGLMAKCDLIHADLKPDNMLVNDDRNRLKVADFGSAIALRDVQITGELVSRYYRAPEIMIGMKGDTALDMWSVGCTLFELYTGKFCFTGTDVNQMLKQIMEAKGKIPNRMLKKAEYWQDHFDGDGTFISKETDNITHRQVVRKLNMSRTVPSKEIRSRIFASSTDLDAEEIKELNLFADLVDKCLALDPSRRIRPHEALKHAFITRTTAAK